MKIFRFLIILLMFSPVFAQPGPGMGRGSEDGPMRQRIREKVKMVKIWRLTEAVGLTPEQSEKFFPVYNQHQKRMEDFEKAKREILDRIKRLSDDPNSSDDEISAAVEEFKAHHRKLGELRESFLGDISGILSVRQRGKLVVFEEEFRRGIQRIIGDIRREFRGGPGNRKRY
ncbi:MAG: periplasmic heavy metal sensor [candidate division Zixibacteria bacterium]